MARHRRSPTKKSAKSKNAKLKDVVEQKTEEALIATLPMASSDRKGRKLNHAPPAALLEDQPIPWKWRELNQLAEKAKKEQQTPRRNKPKNRLIEETQKLGFHHRPWEDPRRLVYRVQNEQNKAINEEILKARFGTAGRDVKEIARDYKAMDEKAKQLKMQEMARREKMKKEREKQRMFREKQRLIRRVGNEIREDGGNDRQNGEENDEKMEESDEKEEAVSMKPKIGGKMKVSNTSKQMTRKRLNNTDKARLKRRRERQGTEKELMLNARELIPFGERVDAPPTFGGEFAQKIRPLYPQAGKKDLLLKRMLRPTASGGDA